MADIDFLLKPTNWKQLPYFGLYIPREMNVYYEKPLDNIRVYATYKELYPKNKNNIKIIRKLYEKYYLNDIVQSLCKINYIISIKYPGGSLGDYKVALDLLRDCTDEIDKLKLNRKFFSRQLLLANIKLAIVDSSNINSNLLVRNNVNEFANLFFRISNFLDSEHFSEKKDIYINILRNILFNATYSFSSAVARYSLIFDDLGESIKDSSGKTINKIFFEKIGFSYDFYLAIGFSVWGFYRKEKFEERLKDPREFIMSSSYFVNANKYTRLNHSKALDIISNDFIGMKKDLIKEEKQNGEYFSFQSFFRNPFIKDNNTYYLVDNNYLERRITEGAFWQIFDRLKENKLKREFKNYWGKLFEKYAFNLTASVYLRDRLLSEIDGDSTYGVDLIIYYPSTLVLVEFTTRKIPYNLWISADKKAIQEELKKLLIKGERRGKATQLFELWKKIKDKTASLKDIDMNTITRVIPVVVFENGIPMHQGSWSFYEDILLENGIDKQFTKDLLFWDIEEYEYILGLVESGKTIIQFIDDMEKKYFKHNPVNNFISKFKLGYKLPKYLKNAFDKHTSKLTKTLFK